MCTVTYIRTGDKAVLTSNRDEHVDRPASIPPQVYYVNRKKVFFPKDPKAGGTWFAVDDDANAAVLLNGAKVIHQPGQAYVKSRGLVLLEILTADNPLVMWENYLAQGIEPFTLILFWKDNLYQLRWDAKVKEKITLDPRQCHIWSSCTLYSPTLQYEKAESFMNYLAEFGTTADAVKDFHLQPGNDQKEGSVINRGDGTKTLSVTQAVIHHNKASLFHYDLLQESTFANSFVIV